MFVQSPLKLVELVGHVSGLEDFPQVAIRSLEMDNHFPTLDWQRTAAKNMVEQFLNLPIWIQVKEGGREGIVYYGEKESRRCVVGERRERERCVLGE